MNAKKIYTIGYSGRTVNDLILIIGKGILLDIRLSPKSRKPGFSKKQLEKAFADKYVWLYELGNENYSGNGKVKLYDPEPGIEIVRRLRRQTKLPMFIMCVCKDGNTCHRRVVGDMLRELGYEVEEYPG